MYTDVVHCVCLLMSALLAQGEIKITFEENKEMANAEFKAPLSTSGSAPYMVNWHQ